METKSRQDVMMDQGYCSASQAARVCHCSVYKIYRMLNEGQITGMVVQGHRYVLATSLLERFTENDRHMLGISLEALLAPKPPRLIEPTG